MRSRLSPVSRVSQNSSRVDRLREFERYHVNSFDIIIYGIWYTVIYIYILLFGASMQDLALCQR